MLRLKSFILLNKFGEEAQNILSEKFEDYRILVQDSSIPVPWAGELTFVPHIESIEFNPTQKIFSVVGNGA